MSEVPLLNRCLLISIFITSFYRSCVSKNNQPWVGLGQLTDTETFNEQAKVEMPAHSLADQVGQADEVEMKSNRRDFLKMMGFGLGAATAAAACDIPRKYAVPYVTKPDSIVPGVATYYASSFVSGNDFCPILVKTREGRPIKIEGNSASGMLGSGTTARAQASVLGLYDIERLQGPVQISRTEGERPAAIGWDDIDEKMAKLPATANVHVITNTVHSPSLNAAIAEFKAAYPNTKVVTYDTATSSAAIQANAESFGKAVLPGYHFDKADVVVGIDCDFLGTWVFPSLFSSQYAKRRRVVNQLKPTMNRHYQVESTMTLTGSNADHRVRVKPSHIGQAIIELHNQVASLTGGSSAGSARVGADQKKVLATAAKDLVAAKGSALVVSGSNNIAEQKLVNAINAMLGAYGKTIDFSRPTKLRKGLDKEIQMSIAAMAAGNVDAVIFHGDVNPAYDYPQSDRFMAAVAKVPLKVSLTSTKNETMTLCDMVAPDHHVLESWGDAEPIGGVYTVIQPTIHQLWNTRQAGHSFLTWAKSTSLNTAAEQPYFEYIRGVWKNATFPTQTRFANFDSFWDSALSEGVFVGGPTYSEEEMTGFSGSGSAAGVRKPGAEGALEMVISESVAIGHGQYAGNPWLQEVPDPVTRTCWGNYLQVPVTYSGGGTYDVFNNLNGDELKGKTDIVGITSNGTTADASCVIQFGMADDTVGISAGYGRSVVGKAGKGIGTNVTPWTSLDADGNRQYYTTDVAVSEATGEDDRFAIVQYHHTMGVTGMDGDEPVVVDEERTLFGGYGGIANGYEGNLTERSIIRRADLDEVEHFVEELVHEREHHQKLNSHSLYDGHDDAYKLGHHWGMFVDLNSCTGCSACVVACISENNTPVVGKNEVARHHEMTWLRIDRYCVSTVITLLVRMFVQ